MGRILIVSGLLALVAIYLMFFTGDQFEPKSIKDQRVLVTGASSGIGEQLAYQYAKLGARLVITARRADLLSKVSRMCLDLGAPEVHLVAADMDAPGDRVKIVEHVLRHLGGLDHLILNHAILTEGWWQGSAENLTHLEQVHRVNFLSYVDMTSKLLPVLTASRGRIGIVSSGLGQTGCAMTSIYSSAKSALHGFFSSLNQELRYKNSGVSVSLVVLGLVASDNMIDLITAMAAHLPVSYMATATAAAQEVLESVTQRRYKTYFDWKTKIILRVHGIFPEFIEEHSLDILQNNGRRWQSRFYLFLLRTFY